MKKLLLFVYSVIILFCLQNSLQTQSTSTIQNPLLEKVDIELIKTKDDEISFYEKTPLSYFIFCLSAGITASSALYTLIEFYKSTNGNKKTYEREGMITGIVGAIITVIAHNVSRSFQEKKGFPFLILNKENIVFKTNKDIKIKWTDIKNIIFHSYKNPKNFFDSNLTSKSNMIEIQETQKWHWIVSDEYSLPCSFDTIFDIINTYYDTYYKEHQQHSKNLLNKMKSRRPTIF